MKHLRTFGFPGHRPGTKPRMWSQYRLAARLFPQAGALLVILVDQPLVSRAYLRKILKEHLDFPSHIIASDYGGFAGVPALFPRPYWEGLKGLSADKGAKALIASHREQCRILDPGPAITDVDTPEAYEKALLEAELKENNEES